MGAGDITKWAGALADGICEARSRQMSAVATMPKVRGRLTPNAPLAPLVWFKSGGTAEWLFEPADVDDLAAFLGEIDPQMPVMALGLGSNLIVRDGGVPRRRRPPRQAVREDRPPRRDHACAAAAVRAASSSPRPRATPASRVSNSCAAFPARSAASCG